MNAKEYIESRVDAQINWYDKKSSFNKRWHITLQIGQIVIAAFIPVGAGYVNGSSWLPCAIGIAGATVAASSGIASLFKFQENWLEYRTTCESLRHEKNYFLTSTPPFDTDGAFNLFVEKCETLISKENTNWAQYSQKKKEKVKNIPRNIPS